MKYNIDFNVLSALFLLVYYVFLRVQYNSEAPANRCFRLLVLAVLAADIMDTVTAVTISYSATVPLGLNYLLNCVYFIAAAFSVVMLPTYLRYLLDASGKKTPFVKIMGLPKRRKLYRNPYITTADLTKNRE